MTGLVFLAVGALVGGIGAWLAASSKSNGILDEVRTQAANLQASVEARQRDFVSLQSELRRESEEKVKAQTALEQTRLRVEEGRQRLDEERLRWEEEKKLFQDAETNLANAFDALAGKALTSNNQAFLDLATSTFATLQAQAAGDLETRQKAIDGVVAPLKDSLTRYEKQILEMEKHRQESYGGLGRQLADLQGVTRSLDVALRNPQSRGSWGELTLRRVAERAGMSEHCDFVEQETLTGGTARQRPDLIVNLPDGHRIVIDAKTPLQAFREASECVSDEERKAHLKRHSQHVRNHMNQLGARSYWEQLDQATDLVVLFLPGESFFCAALQQDEMLMEDGIEKKVFLASPITLIALLRSIAYGWRQEQVAKNAQEISALGKDLYEKIKKFVEHFEGVGTLLEKAVDRYNQAAGSLDKNMIRSARKFRELGAASSEEIPDIKIIEELPRALVIPERSEP